MPRSPLRPATASALALLLLAATGCNTVGPQAVRSGQAAYNRVLADNFKEQLLLNLVRLRYRDVPYFLDVQTLTTSYEVEATASLGLGLEEGGSASGSSGLGILVEDDPTVVYAPLQGEKYVKQLLAAIPLETVMLLPQSGWSIERVFRIAVQGLEAPGIRRLPNAPSASGPTPSQAPEYLEFLELTRTLRDLQRRGALAVQPCAADPGGASDGGAAGGRCYRLEIAPRGAGTGDLPTLREQLGLPGGAGAADRISLSFTTRRDAAGGEDLVLATRSLMGILYFLSQGIEVPPAHETAGLVTVTREDDGARFSWRPVVGDLFTVRAAPRAPGPEEAFVAVPYQGHWFYIAQSDLETKTTFGLLAQLVSLQSGDQRVTPVLAFGGD